jgi:hypothetical protein
VRLLFSELAARSQRREFKIHITSLHEISVFFKSHLIQEFFLIPTFCRQLLMRRLLQCLSPFFIPRDLGRSAALVAAWKSSVTPWSRRAEVSQ